MARTFGHCELLTVADTLQYPDYGKYESELFDKEAKIKRHREIFPKDCQRAFEIAAVSRADTPLVLMRDIHGRAAGRAEHRALRKHVQAALPD